MDQILATVPIETMMTEIGGRARTPSHSDDVLQMLCSSSKYQQRFSVGVKRFAHGVGQDQVLDILGHWRPAGLAIQNNPESSSFDGNRPATPPVFLWLVAFG